MAKVIAGMSGGVDSAVAAYLLKQQGYDVVGVTLRTWLSETGEEGRCCEIDDAREIALKLGIPFYPLNCIDEFKKSVIDPFITCYLKGRTPNPCIECNRFVKWERLLYYTKVLKTDYVATGHYASVVKKDNGRYTVKKAVHQEKDQTYMLYKLTQEQLSKTLMPLGSFSKSEVRKIAAEAGIHVAEKPDSQEICFVPDGDYASYIRKMCTDEKICEGDFVDEQGRVIGRHKGIIHYTVGQRKGLGLPLGYPAYVKSIDPVKNQVIISEEEALFSNEVICNELNFLSIPGIEKGETIKCRAKIRYHHKAQEAILIRIDDENIKIIFESPVKAATPGQSAVFYDDDDCVIGGGIISAQL
ncbi:MAG: tRNA 2-thiouridine(34) synthase MnmA [Lachnospiraceae bacterium]|nr:tRNA 2-thiouridine(34) synthase MnmA [Lachnospiraceae bacterium]